MCKLEVAEFKWKIICKWDINVAKNDAGIMNCNSAR